LQFHDFFNLPANFKNICGSPQHVYMLSGDGIFCLSNVTELLWRVLDKQKERISGSVEEYVQLPHYPKNKTPVIPNECEESCKISHFVQNKDFSLHSK